MFGGGGPAGMPRTARRPSLGRSSSTGGASPPDQHLPPSPHSPFSGASSTTRSASSHRGRRHPTMPPPLAAAAAATSSSSAAADYIQQPRSRSRSHSLQRRLDRWDGTAAVPMAVAAPTTASTTRRATTMPSPPLPHTSSSISSPISPSRGRAASPHMMTTTATTTTTTPYAAASYPMPVSSPRSAPTAVVGVGASLTQSHWSHSNNINGHRSSGSSISNSNHMRMAAAATTMAAGAVPNRVSMTRQSSVASSGSAVGTTTKSHHSNKNHNNNDISMPSPRGVSGGGESPTMNSGNEIATATTIFPSIPWSNSLLSSSSMTQQQQQHQQQPSHSTTSNSIASTSTRTKRSSSDALPPLFYYMERGDWDRAADRIRRHPREVKTWANIRSKADEGGGVGAMSSTSAAAATASTTTSKRLALHHACFKLRGVGSAAPPAAGRPSDDPFVQVCRFILVLIRLYPEAAGQRESRHGCLPLHLAAFASCAPRGGETIPTPTHAQQQQQSPPLIHHTLSSDTASAAAALSRNGSTSSSGGRRAATSLSPMRDSTTATTTASPSSFSILSNLHRPKSMTRRTSSDATNETTQTNLSDIHAEESYAGGMGDKVIRRSEAHRSAGDAQVSVSMRVMGRINEKREEMAVQVINALLDAYPKAVRVDSEGGRLPLHTACAGRATPRVIATLVTAYPAAARHRNKDGFLPLHLAAHWGVSHPQVAVTLLRAYPDATVGRNRWERTPLEEALCMAGENGRPHQSSLVRALRKHPSYWTRPPISSSAAEEEWTLLQDPVSMTIVPSSPASNHVVPSTPPTPSSIASRTVQQQQRHNVSPPRRPGTAAVARGGHHGSSNMMMMISTAVDMDESLPSTEDTTLLLEQHEQLHHLQHPPPPPPPPPPPAWTTPMAAMMAHMTLQDDDGDDDDDEEDNENGNDNNGRDEVKHVAAATMDEQTSMMYEEEMDLDEDLDGMGQEVALEQTIQHAIQASGSSGGAAGLIKRLSPSPLMIVGRGGKKVFLEDAAVHSSFTPVAVAPVAVTATPPPVQSTISNSHQQHQPPKPVDLALGKSLPSLIHNQRWPTVIARVRHNPPEAKEELQVMTRGGFLTSTGMTPLHYTCERDPPAEVVQALVDAYPAAVMIRAMPGGCLPVHIACTWHVSSVSVIRVLLAANPASVTIKDELGNLPLHSACFSGIRADAVEALIMVPEDQGKSVFARNHQGSRPMDICKRLRHDNRHAVMHVLAARKEQILKLHRRSRSSGTWSEIAREAEELNQREGIILSQSRHDDDLQENGMAVEVTYQNDDHQELLWI